MPRLERPHPADEPEAIELGQQNLRPLEPRSFVPDDDDVDRIRLDSVGAPFAAEDEVVVAPLAGPARRPVSLALSLGVLAGVLVGVGVGFWLRHDLARMRAPAVAASPSPASGGPVLADGASSPAPPSRARRQAAAEQPQTLNLAQLERSVETSRQNAAEGRFPPSPPAAPARPAPVQLATSRAQPPPALPPPAVALPPATAEVAALAAEPAPPPRPALDSQMEQANQRLNLAYDFAMAKSQDRTALHDEQEAWLSARERLTGGRESWMAMTKDRTDTLNAQGKRDRRRR